MRRAPWYRGTNFTFDKVVFHDVRVTDSSVHNECLYAIVLPGLTVRRSTFHDCATMDIFFTYGSWWNPLPPAYGKVTLENNVFAHTYKDDGSWHYYSLYVANTANNGGTLDGWTVRNNTFEIPAASEHGATGGTRWVEQPRRLDLRVGHALQPQRRQEVRDHRQAGEPRRQHEHPARRLRLGQPGRERFPPQRRVAGHQRRGSERPRDHRPAVKRRAAGAPDAGALER